jgi:hypothetical protein
MIIWINGAFGVGKTHTAYELHRRYSNSFIFDPEKVGYFLRKYLPKTEEYDDFQKIPLWRQQVRENLIYCDKKFSIVIVPMTIIDDEIFDYIIGGLINEGIELKHFALLADKSTIEKRLIKRGDKNAWNFKQVTKCLNSLSKEKYGEHIDTQSLDIDTVVEKIAKSVKIELEKPKLTKIQKKIHWLRITIKHLTKL